MLYANLDYDDHLLVEFYHWGFRTDNSDRIVYTGAGWGAGQGVGMFHNDSDNAPGRSEHVVGSCREPSTTLVPVGLTA